MKIQVNQKDLLKGLNFVCKAVSAKTTLKILQCVKMQIIENNSLLLSANDTELAIETKMPCTVIEADNIPIYLEAGIFSNIIKKIPAGLIEISKNDSTVSIIQEKMSFQLQTINGNFPAIPEITGDTVIMSNIDVKKSIKKTLFATSKTENNPTLKGIEIKFSGNSARFMATDGFRIAIQNAKIEKTSEEKACIVPDKTMQELAKILPDKDELAITFSKNHIMFLFEDTKVVSRIISGAMPKVERFFQTSSKTDVLLDKMILQESLERAMLFSAAETPITLDIQPNLLNLSLESKTGKFSDVIFSDVTGENLTIHFSPELLIEIIKAIDDEEISMKFTGGLSPCFIQGENYTYLVLPIGKK